MELNQLQIFCVAAETLNFTKTAHQLGYAQSNITAQIKQLENSLQVRLFERLGRNIQLTNEGIRFLVHAKAILQLCTRAKEEFSPDVFRGNLTIGAAETICIHRLPKILNEYRRLYPLVQLQVLTESCDTFIELIKINQIDIALVLTDRVKSNEMLARTLYAESMVVVSSPQAPLARRQEIGPADLADECLIITLPGCGYRPAILSMLNNCNVKPRSFMELSSVGAMKEFTSCGLGVAFLPRVSVQAELTTGKLKELAWRGPQLDVKTQLFYHREKWVSAPMRAFLDLCAADATSVQE